MIVSIIIPCRNEEKYLAPCLDSIIESTFPKENLEILVIDGKSNDGTTKIAQHYAKKYSYIRFFENPGLTTPIALNIGIRSSSGKYVIILGSHSKITPDFISLNVQMMEKHQVDCVGGVLVTIPATNSPKSRAIASALSHPFGMGNSYFRIGTDRIRYVDTVPFGCYRRSVFARFGYFDEELTRNQDDEFNYRIINNGGTILLVPQIVSYYHARDNFLKLWQMYFQYGYFKPRVVQKLGKILSWRQLIPGLFVSSLTLLIPLAFLYPLGRMALLGLLGFYFSISLFVSLKRAFRKNWKEIFYLPAAFTILHFSYGMGYIKGIWDFFILKGKNKPAVLLEIPPNR
ncbi:MAG: glycosyltransferase family 2 protein [Calditrichaeota bacterium]|nr:glycosyltransferase family 2 protein [Calditrichota bacterium]